LISGLIACTRREKEEKYVENPIVANLTQHERDLIKKIQMAGIQVIKQGMKFTFVLPTDCFFVKETRSLKVHREKDLDNLAQFINQYSHYFENPKVRVSGYTDKVWLAPARDKLSLVYAKIIAQYLTEDGIKAHTILVRGEGAKNPIASNQYPMGTAFNRRVEVVVY
jgi:outer membrane protein OmpA-like peptidoglycan-associated protein